jgi:hypothetical protein
MASTPTEQSHDPTFLEIDLSAEVRKIYGAQWNAPTVEYEFTGRTFKRRTEDCGIYETSPDF